MCPGRSRQEGPHDRGCSGIKGHDPRDEEVHLNGEPPWDEDELFRVLLGHSIPFAEGFFESSTWTVWLFQVVMRSGPQCVWE